MVLTCFNMIWWILSSVDALLTSFWFKHVVRFIHCLSIMLIGNTWSNQLATYLLHWNTIFVDSSLILFNVYLFDVISNMATQSTLALWATMFTYHKWFDGTTPRTIAQERNSNHHLYTGQGCQPASRWPHGPPPRWRSSPTGAMSGHPAFRARGGSRRWPLATSKPGLGRCPSLSYKGLLYFGVRWLLIGTLAGYIWY